MHGLLKLKDPRPQEKMGLAGPGKVTLDGLPEKTTKSRIRAPEFLVFTEKRRGETTGPRNEEEAVYLRRKRQQVASTAGVGISFVEHFRRRAPHSSGLASVGVCLNSV